jgi:hypothetical protein
MAKTYTPKGTPYQTQPCLIVAHEIYGIPPCPPEFHVIATWCTLYENPWQTILLAPWDGQTDFDCRDQWDVQLDLARALIAYPEVLSAACSFCRQSPFHPWHAIWNIAEGHQGEKVVPACPWDGLTIQPAHWTPDHWPPENLNNYRQRAPGQRSARG